MIICIECSTELIELPFYNNDNDKFVPSIPFCPNPKCKKHGLLTVTYKEKEADEKSSN